MLPRIGNYIIAAIIAVSFPANAEIIFSTGAGSTFVYPLLSIWSRDYSVEAGNKLVYESVGSGAGITQIKAAKVDFGASDMPLKPEELDQAGLGQFPVVIGGVVPVVNLDGVGPGQMHFTGPLLADIYLGKITKWNDPQIKALNPEIALPNEQIIVAHRTDGSGTTFNWVNYFSKVSPEWKEKVGEGTTVAWPVGVGAKGNEGVTLFVLKNKFSIGYVDYAYVQANKMIYGLVQNKAGHFVQPNTESFQAAAANADWKSAKDFYLVLTDASEENAYPVTATTFILMYKHPKNAVRTKAALDFFKWGLKFGQRQAKTLNYVPLPLSLVQSIERYWATEFDL